MRRLALQALCLFFLTLQSTTVYAAEKVYQAKAAFYMLGGVKPGPLDPDKFWVAVTPKLVTEVFEAVVDLRADDGSGPKVIGTGSCGFVNTPATAADIPSIYRGVSCNQFKSPNPNTAGGAVIIPEGAKITAAVIATYPLFKQAINECAKEPDKICIRGALSKPFDSIVRQLPKAKQNGCPDVSANPPSPLGGPKRLVFRTYINDRTYSRPEKFPPLIAGKSICFSVTPQGAGIMGLALRGALYRIENGAEILVGSFQCQTVGIEEILLEGKQMMISDSSCSPTPANVEFKRNLPLIARISASFSTPPGDRTYDDIVPITAHFPVVPPE